MNLRELFERQNKRVYRVAMLYLKNEADAEDAVQNVFLKYMKKGIVFESEGHENAWFIIVTRNYCKDVLKAFWRKKVDLGEIPEQVETERETGFLLSHIQELPQKYREVLYLYYYEEYSIRDMSVILHRKESTIQTQLAAARKRLQVILEREGVEYES
jgi:RNA polymerase sigma-70 factor (ECF subfamily)